MRDRHLFWDVAPFLLLFALMVLLGIIVVQNERGWAVMQEIQKSQTELTKQNREILTKLSEGVKVQGGVKVEVHGNPNTTATNTNTNTNPNGQQTPLDTPKPVDDLVGEITVGKMYPGPHGDEEATDGDWLIDADMEDPKSLNALVENAADISSLFGRAHDNLCERAFKDLSYWEPRIAYAWSKTLVCLMYPKDGDAKSLAEKIDAKWDAELKKKPQIRSITAVEGEGRPAVQFIISNVNNDYREQLKKDFADQIFQQWWFYVTFKEPGEMKDGTSIDATFAAKFLMNKIKEAGAKGVFIDPIKNTTRIGVRLLGSAEERDALEKLLTQITDAPDNKCMVFDAKEASGKREDTFLTYEQVEDYLAQEKPVFTFYLRKDVRWHDGKPVTGKDVVWTFKTTMDPRIECGPQRNYLQDLESVTLVKDDPYIVRFTWIKPYFDAWAFSASFTPMSEAYYHYDNPKEFNSGPKNLWLVGDGAWKLEKWDRQQEIVFVRNEDYYGPKPHLSRRVTRIVKDRQVQLQLFEDQKLDLLGLQPSQMKARENNKEFLDKFNINISIASNYRYIGWNARNVLFKDKLVRQALTMMVDQKKICTDIMRGYAIPQYGTVHPENPAYWKDIEKNAWPYDPDRAIKQLAAAGWKDTDGDGVIDKDGVPFRFTLQIVSGSPEYEAMANLIKSSFAKAGIEVKVNNLDWSAFLEKVNRLQFEAVILGWALGAGEEDPYQLWHSSQNHEKESNYCNFVNKRADQIIEECRRELDSKKRYQKLAEFQKIILEEQPYTFLFVSKRLVAYDKRIQNVQFRLQGNNGDNWWVPTKVQRYK